MDHEVAHIPDCCTWPKRGGVQKCGEQTLTHMWPLSHMMQMFNGSGNIRKTWHLETCGTDLILIVWVVLECGVRSKNFTKAKDFTSQTIVAVKAPINSDAEDLARLPCEEIRCWFGLLLNLRMKNDVCFVGDVWQSPLNLCGSRLRFTSSYNPTFYHGSVPISKSSKLCVHVWQLLLDLMSALLYLTFMSALLPAWNKSNLFMVSQHKCLWTRDCLS